MTNIATKYWVGGTGDLDGVDTTHISDSSGGAGGATYPSSADTLVLNGSSGGGTVTVTSNINFTGFDMSAFGGTVTFGATNPTLGNFRCNGTGVRTLNMGSGNWTITGNNGAVWNFNNITNLTFDKGTAVVNFTYSGGTGTRSFFINLPSVRPYRVNITAGTDIIDFSSGNFEDLDFTGFTGTLDTDAFTVAGSLTLGTGMTVLTSANALTFTATATGKTFTTNGVQFNRPITFNGAGGGWTLQDNLDMSGASFRALNLTAGTLDYNGKTITCGSWSSNNSNVRSVIMGAATLNLLGTGTVFNNGGANSTASMASSTIVIHDISASTKALSAGTGNGSGTFGTITLMPGGSGSFTFNANARTINTLNITGPKTVLFTSGTTTTVTNWNVYGVAGANVAISATTPGSAATISIASGTVNSYFLTLTDSTATGGATFNAYASTNVSGNTGWNFGASRVPSSTRVPIQNIPYSLDLDGSTGYISYGNHAAYALGLGGAMSIRFNLSAQQIDTNTANSRFFATLGDGTLSNFITFIVQNASPFALVADVRSGGVSNTITSSPIVTNLLDGEWHDAAVIWGPDGKSLILDGVLVAFDTIPSTVPALGATPDLVSGRLNSGINGRYLTGNLQGLRLFSAGTTLAQIQDLHFRNITPSTQVAYWPGTEGSGTSMAVTGSGNAGTLVGGVTWSTDTPQMARAAVSGRVAVANRVAA